MIKLQRNFIQNPNIFIQNLDLEMKSAKWQPLR